MLSVLKLVSHNYKQNCVVHLGDDKMFTLIQCVHSNASPLLRPCCGKGLGKQLALEQMDCFSSRHDR